MPIAKITGQGLSLIALSVALLWGCLIGERIVMNRAAAEQSRALHEIELLQRNRQHRPASSPIPFRQPRVRPEAA